MQILDSLSSKVAYLMPSPWWWHRLYLVLEILSFTHHRVLACEKLHLNGKVHQSHWKAALQSGDEVADMFLKYLLMLFSKQPRFQWLNSLCRKAMGSKKCWEDFQQLAFCCSHENSQEGRQHSKAEVKVKLPILDALGWLKAWQETTGLCASLWHRLSADNSPHLLFSAS